MQLARAVVPVVPVAPDLPSPLPDVANLDRLRSVLSAGAAHLGDLVWWTLCDAKLSRSELERVWREAQLPMELLPELPTAEKALKLAVRAAQVGQSEHLIRLAKDDDDELVFAIVRESKPGDGTLLHAQQARVTLRRTVTALTSDAPEHPVVQSLVEAFHAHRDVHTPDDVRRTLVRTLKTWAAVTLREGGGVYWVPRAYAAPLRRLEAAVAKLGTSQFHVIPVHQSVQATQTLGSVARGSIEAELASLKDELEGFREQPPERSGTLERRLEAFEALRSRALLYRDILQVEVADLEGRLDAMADDVKALLVGGAA